MKGLLLKDIYMALKYCRAYLLITLVFAIVFMIEDTNLFFLFYPMILAGVIPVNLISYDEKSGWMTYSAIMPYTRRQMVTAKYIFVLMVLGGSVALVTVTRLIHTFFAGQTDWVGFIMAIVLLVAASMVVPSLLLPVVFKYGVEKGRLFFYIVVVVAAGGCGAIGAAAVDNSFIDMLASIGGWLAPLALATSALLLTGSWLLSIRFYEKREL